MHQSTNKGQQKNVKLELHNGEAQSIFINWNLRLNTAARADKFVTLNFYFARQWLNSLQGFILDSN